MFLLSEFSTESCKTHLAPSFWEIIKKFHLFTPAGSSTCSNYQTGVNCSSETTQTHGPTPITYQQFNFVLLIFTNPCKESLKASLLLL